MIASKMELCTLKQKLYNYVTKGALHITNSSVQAIIVPRSRRPEFILQTAPLNFISHHIPLGNSSH